MAEPVRQLGPYRLLSKIGRGAFGVVWLAEKQTSIVTTRFALKLSRDEDIDLEAFKQEATIWVQASGHPNVLPIIEADIYDEQVVIVSEYVPDGSLAAWLKQHGGRALSIESACEIIDGVLAGLAHLHERRIIHRDLKPDNILLQRDTPRLTDFGIARLLRSGSYSTNVSGTLAYMAPEAFDGKRNERTDIWSVGVIFYQLLAGQLPYAQRDMASLIAAITRGDFPPLPDAVPEVLRDIVTKALQRDSDKRYASAAEMRRDLREAEHNLWLSKRTPTLRDPVAPPIRTPRDSEALKRYLRKLIAPPAPTPEPVIPAPPPIEQPPPKIEQSPIEPAPTLKIPDAARPQVIPAKVPTRLRTWLPTLGGLLLLAIIFSWGIYRGVNSEIPIETSAALERTLPGHNGNVYGVAFSPDGETLASGGGDGTIRLWDAETGAPKQTLPGHATAVNAVAFSPDGKMIASAGHDGTVKLWELQSGKVKYPLSDHNSYVFSVAFSPDGKILASGGYDRTVKLWNTQRGTFLQDLDGHTDYIRAVAFSPDGKTLASASDDKTVKLWDIQSGKVKQTLTGHIDYVKSIDFSPDGQTLASGGDDDTVRLWNVQTGSQLRVLRGHTNNVQSVAFSPDGKMLASGSFDETVKLWDAQTGIRKETFYGHSYYVFSVAFSPDGTTLASASSDNTVKLWHITPSNTTRQSSFVSSAISNGK